MGESMTVIKNWNWQSDVCKHSIYINFEKVIEKHMMNYVILLMIHAAHALKTNKSKLIAIEMLRINALNHVNLKDKKNLA